MLAPDRVRGDAYAEVLQVVHGELVAEEVEKGILKHASVTVPAITRVLAQSPSFIQTGALRSAPKPATPPYSFAVDSVKLFVPNGAYIVSNRASQR